MKIFKDIKNYFVQDNSLPFPIIKVSSVRIASPKIYQIASVLPAASWEPSIETAEQLSTLFVYIQYLVNNHIYMSVI